MNFLIIGGHFKNNGAQSMLMITVSELNKRFPGCKIYVNSPNDFLEKDHYENYRFEMLGMDYFVFDYFDKGNTFEARLRNYAKHFFKNKMSHSRKALKRYREILSDTEIAIDISGYVLSSQWGAINSRGYLQIINVCNKFDIDYYVFPQSIGPFNYAAEKEEISREIKETLSHCKIVMPREPEGLELLRSLGLSNVVLSNDIVLLNKSIDLECLFKKTPDLKHIDIPTEHNVAIIPNMRIYDHGNVAAINDMYESAIDHLLSLTKNVYLISHTKEDISACKTIKAKYEDDDRVTIIEDELDCFSFGYLIRQFDFAIASRFHSIVNAYKEGVPCIALGWATKYRNLLNLFDQGEYMFDVRDCIDVNGILMSIDTLEQNLSSDKESIKNMLQSIQTKNCFDYLGK